MIMMFMIITMITICPPVQSSVKDLRHAATEEMKNNPDDYLPFLSNASGDMLDQEGFENYCQKMLETPAWGGQVPNKNFIM